MTKTFGTLALAAALAAGTAFSASAASVSILWSADQGGSNTAGSGLTANYGAVTPTGATWAADPTVTPPPGDIGGVYESPFSNNSLTDTQSFFAVGGVNGFNGAASGDILTLASATDTFKFLWGSIDDYNTLNFLDSIGNVVASYTGTQIAQLINPAIVPVDAAGNYEKVALVQFNLDTQFSKVQFKSSPAAFEFAFVPVPAAGLMLLTAFGGLGGLASMRRRKKA